MKILDSSDAELDAFDSTCQRLGGFGNRVTPEWADGYLTALAAGPRRVDIDEWLPLMAHDAFKRAFADPEDAQQARQSLLARARVLASHLDPEALLDDPEGLRLQPLAAVWDDAARQALVDEHGASAEDAAGMTTGALWAEGFFDAVEDFAADWAVPGLRHRRGACGLRRDPAARVGAAAARGQRRTPGPTCSATGRTATATREELLDEACFAIQDLRVWWVDHAPRPATRRVASTARAQRPLSLRQRAEVQEVPWPVGLSGTGCR